MALTTNPELDRLESINGNSTKGTRDGDKAGLRATGRPLSTSGPFVPVTVSVRGHLGGGLSPQAVESGQAWGQVVTWGSWSGASYQAKGEAVS